MAKKNIIRGQFTKFNVTGERVTQSLIEALNILDRECSRGSGGAWDIERDGRTYVATPTSGAFDSLYFNRKKKAWLE